ncbi:phosphoribosylanthranilate isomerase [Virgibacillus ainsalahensis]
MLVKICGIRTEQAASAAVQAGADFIGFVFAPSKRQITPAEAEAIAKSLPTTVKKVGVFVNEPPENMKQIAEQVGLDYIQLHGDESTKIAEALPYKVIKAFPVDKDTISKIESYPCDFYLLDSPFGKNRGGNGTSFDWNLIESLSINQGKIILAGGLAPKNVQGAINLVNPAGVDVSSGVETDGKKDHEKIRQFIRNAKHT